jgi:hypothetical protein
MLGRLLEMPAELWSFLLTMEECTLIGGWSGGFDGGGLFFKSIGAVAAAGLAAPAAAQMVSLGENDVRAVVVELARLGEWGDARLFVAFGFWSRRGHTSIFADGVKAAAHFVMKVWCRARCCRVYLQAQGLLDNVMEEYIDVRNSMSPSMDIGQGAS